MPKRSKFSLSHYKLFSCDMGELIPCGLTEVLPGDTIQQNTTALVRCSPLVAPVMHPVHVRLHHFYVPFRLIWDEFEDFITGGPTGMNTSEVPFVSPGQFSQYSSPGSLGDYLGLPVINGGVPLTVSALPFRAYSLIWNEYFRDQDLQAELPVAKTSGADLTTNNQLQHIAWEKDYFTSSRPWEQKGPSITIPLGQYAPVVSDGPIVTQSAPSDVNTLFLDAGNITYKSQNTPATSGPQHLKSGLQADLRSASAVTVNVLREALALQRFEEARARYGSRYVEYLRYLGVRGSDARLQRPEYLGGGSQTIQFSEVLQTAEGTDPVGDLKGHGIAAMRSNRYRRFIEEHGYILSLFSVRPKTIYMNSVSRTWLRKSKEDFWQKELQHIGQQEVYNAEIFANNTTPMARFGFQDRYDEYRRQESTVAGEFRLSLLDYWHMARNFASAPALNESFIKCIPPERSFAVPSQDVLYVMARHKIAARRLVARTGTSHIF